MCFSMAVAFHYYISSCKKVYKSLHFVYYVITYVRLPNARMLNIWLNIKNNSSRRRIKKIGDCHATDYAFLRLWYKFEVRKFSRFARFTFRVK